MAEFVGHDFGESTPFVLDQERINRFADCTEDRQWMHVDIDRARRESPFGGPVAHGYLTLSILSAALPSTGIFPADAKGILNYGLDKIRFLAPVPADSAIRVGARLGAVEPKGAGRHVIRIEIAVTVEGNDRPALVGDALAMILG